MLRKLDTTLDLTKGEREYLKDLGVSHDEFNNMDAVSQHEWLEECKQGSYEKNRKEAKYFGWNK